MDGMVKHHGHAVEQNPTTILGYEVCDLSAGNHWQKLDRKQSCVQAAMN